MPPLGAWAWDAEREGLSSLRSDIPKGEVLAFTAHAGTSFLAFFIFGIRSGKPSSSPNKKCPRWGHGLGMRRERDSNPRTCYSQRFSRPPQSTTLPSLRRKCTPKSGFGAHKPSRGPSGPKGRDPELIESRLYRRGVLGHRASGQVQKAQDQEDGRKEQPTGQSQPHAVQAIGTVQNQVGSQG